MNIKTIIFRILSILLGLVFIFSAYVKLFPIEILEIAIVETGLVGWSLAPIFARLLLASEFALGVFLIMNIKPKLVNIFVMLSLLVFSIYLSIILIFQGNSVNCNCFGLFMIMNPFESILKNILMIALSVLLYFKNTAVDYKKDWLVIGVGAVLVSSIPFIINPPVFDKSKFGYEIEEPYLMDLSVVYDDADVEQPKIDLREGKHLIAFYSSNCQHCVVAAYSLQLISKRNPDLSFYFFINGDEEDIKEFHNLTKSEHVPHSILLAQPFVMLAGNRFPAVFLVEDSYVQERIHPAAVDEKMILEWFER
ncbi:MAG: MauE/DoxX family redox-associated membrane protein [Bacteroidales bacterium]